MADIIKISDATALALHSMVYLASEPGVPVATAEIANTFNVSKHHLAKVHQKLVKAGLIRSYRGSKGGIGLEKNPSKITLLDIYMVMEGSMLCNPCLFGKNRCPQSDCVLSSFLPELVDQVQDYFKKTTLTQLAKESNWRKNKK